MKIWNSLNNELKAEISLITFKHNSKKALIAVAWAFIAGQGERQSAEIASFFLMSMSNNHGMMGMML